MAWQRQSIGECDPLLPVRMVGESQIHSKHSDTLHPRISVILTKVRVGPSVRNVLPGEGNSPARWTRSFVVSAPSQSDVSDSCSWLSGNPMATTEVTISLRQLGYGLKVSAEQVQAVVELLDAGNTIPFITRYRKDQTGGLDEEKVSAIAEHLARERQLAERKQTILRSIELQNKLTPSLAKQILGARTLKWLEDLYLPYKPKKQTLASVARERGLDHLAEEILNREQIAADLDKRAADYVNPDKQVTSGADALLGAGHILAERFSESADLRQRLRAILFKTGRISTTLTEEAAKALAGDAPASSPETPTPDASNQAAAPQTAGDHIAEEQTAGEQRVGEQRAEEQAASEQTAGESAPGQPSVPQPSDLGTPHSGPDQAASGSFVEQQAGAQGGVAVSSSEAAPQSSGEALGGENKAVESVPRNPGEEASAGSSSAASSAEVSVHGEGGQHAEATPAAVTEAPASSPDATAVSTHPAQVDTAAAQVAVASSAAPPPAAPRTVPLKPALSAKEEERRKKRERFLRAFADYAHYSEGLRSIPPHRVLAINRGERERVLRVKIEVDSESLQKAAEEICVPPDHPHAEFLRGCEKAALSRMVLPSLEREIRRELNEKAEAHAVQVFARNLRRLLLQPPVRNHTILAIDPGLRQGCKFTVLDPYGKVLDHGVFFIVGASQRVANARQRVLEIVQTHGVTLIALGNGTGCRETEEFLANLMQNEWKDGGPAYVIVNEAGASVYSVSQLGREELPTFDAAARGAICIGRRLLDPLSELVKIEPAALGVGLYQHDLKPKNLEHSLDQVVQSCVSFVGVDVNTGSPALLTYVSGLNQLTARRIYEYRQEHGPFRNREQLKQIPGIGEATFVQAAGFLKITDGDNPLDATWIHPESYDIARRVMEKLGVAPEQIGQPQMLQPLAEKIAALDVQATAKELGCGPLLLQDILQQLQRPGRDPREDLPPPIFKKGILKMDDLEPDMELSGMVLNVVDFGAFVDVGVKHPGLVHRSRMAPRFIHDPHEVVAPGDIVRVWVVEVDKTRRRISLSMIPPGTPMPSPADGRRRRGRRPEGVRQATPAEGATPATEDGAPTRRPRPSRRRDRPQDRAGERRGGEPSGDRAADSRSRVRTARKPRRDGDSRQAGRGEREDRHAAMRGEGPEISRPVRLPQRLTSSSKAPAAPLSEEVLEGKQPMRSFADLMQYFAAKGAGRSAPGEKGANRSQGQPHGTAANGRSGEGRAKWAAEGQRHATATPPSGPQLPSGSSRTEAPSPPAAEPLAPPPPLPEADSPTNVTLENAESRTPTPPNGDNPDASV